MGYINEGAPDETAIVRREIGVHLIEDGIGKIALLASFLYQRSDPYAVRCFFNAGSDDPIEWIFARELLEVGCAEQAGLGDVRVRPLAGDEKLIQLDLNAPTGGATFYFPRSDTEEFLASTAKIVPYGTEAAVFHELFAQEADIFGIS